MKRLWNRLNRKNDIHLCLSEYTATPCFILDQTSFCSVMHFSVYCDCLWLLFACFLWFLTLTAYFYLMKTKFHSKIKKHSKYSENVSIESLVIWANQAKVIIMGMEIKYWLSNVSSFNVKTNILSSNSPLLTMKNL